MVLGDLIFTVFFGGSLIIYGVICKYHILGVEKSINNIQDLSNATKDQVNKELGGL